MNLEPYIQELILWNTTHNLVSKKEIHNLQEHIDDSLSLCEWIIQYPTDTIIDIGSGGGFPIIPLSFWMKEHNLNYRLIATDVVEKKLTFLKWCVSKFDLNIEIKNMTQFFEFDKEGLIISRAFSSVSNILVWRKKHAPYISEFLLLKGDSVEKELEDANISDYQLIKNPRGYIVKFTNNLLKH